MVNLVPLMALGLVAVGYAGAINALDHAPDPHPRAVAGIVAFQAGPNLSVHGFVGQLPNALQDPLCDVKQTVTSSLTDDFAETLESAWNQQHQMSMELWASDLMGTWTLLRVESDALACIVASGFGWADGMGMKDIVQDGPLS